MLNLKSTLIMCIIKCCYINWFILEKEKLVFEAFMFIKSIFLWIIFWIFIRYYEFVSFNAVINVQCRNVLFSRMENIRGRYSAIFHARSRITREWLLFVIRGDFLSLSRSPLWQSVNAKSRTKHPLSSRVCNFARARDCVSGELLWCADRLRNCRLSLRREGRITGPHWLSLFALWIPQCRVSRLNKNSSFTAALLSNM